MDGIALRNAGFRKNLFDETAERMDIDPHIIEKDFWVCWTLNCLFDMPELKDRLIFRGGTSLSKVYGLIYRFSEDIDLTLDRSLFGFGGGEDPANITGTKSRERSIERMVESCMHYIKSTILPGLEIVFFHKLETQHGTWEIVLDEEDESGQSLLFYYPSALVSAEKSYISPVVKLEFGSRADPWPTQTAKIRSYAAEHFPDVFSKNIKCEVVALSAERTFWEKATILHQEANRAKEKPIGRRYFRHYYDLAMMAQNPIAAQALDNMKLLEAVAKHKQLFFRCAWAKFEEAKPGTLRLLPPDFRIPELKKDFREMEAMLFGKYPSFEDIMEILSKLQSDINAPVQ